MQKVVEVILTETANFGAAPFHMFHRDTSRESWSRDIPVGRQTASCSLPAPQVLKPCLGQAPSTSVDFSMTFSTVAVGSLTPGAAMTEASTQPTSRLTRSR